jgi:peptidoglycan/LPS O-acetylase OafA/YrhL
MPDRLHYIKSLDGIRGVGALVVIAAHYGYLQCGWVVVQFFFVLSGYLITSILLTEKERPFRQYLGRFYWRRILRIFPVYFGFLLIWAILYLLLKQPRELPQLLPSLLTYTYNFYLVPPGRNLSGIFSHLWSLSVEEQFYLLWPFLIFFLTPRGARWMVVGILISIPLLRLLVFAFIYRGPMSGWIIGRFFYLATQFQLDGFAAGAAIAVFRLTDVKVRPTNLLFAIGGALVLGLINLQIAKHSGAIIDFSGYGRAEILFGGMSFGYPLWMPYNGQYLWGYSVMNFLSMALIICASQANVIARFFENRFLCYLGEMSYGIYVVHLPLLYVFTYMFPVHPRTLPGFMVFLVLLATVIAVAHVSYFHFELRFLRMKDYFSKRTERSRRKKLERPLPASPPIL